MNRSDEIKARLAATTSGEWVAENVVDDSGFEQPTLWIIMQAQPMAYGFDRKEDAEFCANAHNADIAFLLAENERLTGELESEKNTVRLLRKMMLEP